MHKLTRLFQTLFFFFFFSISLVNAQSELSASYKGVAGVPDNLNICGDSDNVIVSIRIKDASNSVKSNVQAAVNLFTGIEFVSFDPANSTAGVSVLDDSDPSRPVFRLPDMIPNQLDNVDVAFAIAAKCAIVDTLTANNGVLVFDTWDMTYDFEGATVQQSNATSEYRDAFAIPFFTIEINPFMGVLGVEDCYDRVITVANSSLDGFVDEMVYTNIQGPGVVVNTIHVNDRLIPITKTIGLNGDTIVTATISGDFFVDNNLGPNPSNGDFFFDPDESLTIVENICVKSCTEDRSSLHTASWGCEGALCQESMIDDFLQLGQGNANAVITVSELTPAESAGYCQRGSTSLTISNDGFEIDPDFASMMDLVLGIGMGSGFALSDSGIVGVDVIVSGVTVPTVDALVRLDDNSLFSSDVDGAGGLADIDGDGYFDDLPVGESIELTLVYEFDCSMMKSEEDNCFNDVSTFFSGRVDYYDVVCDTEVSRFLGSFLRPANNNTDVENTSTPDAFANGEIFTITHFESRTIREFDRNCGGNDVLIATLELPQGINPADSDVFLTKNGASTPLNMLSSTFNDSIWELKFDTSNDVFINGNYELQMAFQADCDAEIGVVTIPFKFQFYCPECDCLHSWYCADLEGPFIHKEDPPCGPDPNLVCGIGLKTTNFQVNRTSFGFTDNTYTTPYNEANANQKVAVSCDSVEMLVTTEVGQTPITGSLGFVVNYGNIDETDSAEEIFMFSSGEVLINKNGTMYTCPITPANLTVSADATGFKTLRFELPNCLSSLGITLEPGDEVNFRGDFSVNTEGPYLNQFKIVPQFRAYGFSVENGVDASCESFGDIFTVARTSTLFAFPNSNDFPEGCEETFLNYRVISVYNGFDLEYGDELYPSIKVDSVSFQFDPAIFDGFDVFEPQVSIPGHPIHGDAYFDVPSFESFPDGNYAAYFDTLNIIPSLNEVRSYSFSFRIRVRANCQASLSSAEGTNIYNFDPSFHYQNRYYAKFIGDPACVEVTTEEISNDIQFTEPPTFNLISLTSPDVFLSGDTAVWNIQLCNTSFESDAGLTWFAVQNLGADVAIHSMQDISNPVNPIDLTVVSYGDMGQNYFAFANGVQRANGLNTFNDVCNIIQIKATPERCGTLNINVQSGWNCISYDNTDWTPDLYPPCEDLLLPLSIITEEPFLEANVIEQATEAVDLCEPIDIAILVRNDGQGVALDIKTQLLIPLQGATLVPGSIQFAYPSGADFQPVATDPVLVGTTTRGIVYEYTDFSQLNADLHANGLDGFNPLDPTDSNEFKIKYQIITDCEFVSNSLSFFNFQGLKSCQDSTNLEIGESLPIEINGSGIANNESYNIGITTDSKLIPQEASTIEIFVTNQTDIVSDAANDLISLVIPSTLSYIPNSSVALAPSTWMIGEPTSSTMGDFTTLIWNLPDGLAQNEMAGFQFDLMAADFDCTSNEQAIELTTQGVVEYICVDDNSVCEGTIITSTNNPMTSISINNGSLTYAFSTVTSTCMASSEETLTVNGTITTGNEAFPAQSFPINYVIDSNTNGSIDVSDSEIGSFTITGPIAANSTISFSHQLNVALAIDQVCNVLFSADASAVLGGTCEYFESAVPTPQLQNAGTENLTVCTDQTSFTAVLGDPNCGADYMYNWMAVPSNYTSLLSAVDIAQPSIDLDPSVLSDTEILFVLETARPNCGTSRDTLSLRLADAPDLQVDVPNNGGLCPQEMISLTASGADTYTWTNTANGNVMGTDAVLTLTFTTDMVLSLTGSTNSGCLSTTTVNLFADVTACPCVSPVVTFVSTTASTCDSAQGSATVNIQGDPGAYTYTWSPATGTSVGVGNTRENLSYGGYLITVSDAANAACSTETFALIQNSDGPTATLVTTPATCEAADGRATLTPSTHFYAWSDGGSGAVRNDLTSGIYFVSFTDTTIDSDCGNVMLVLIEEDNPLEAEAMININPTCGQNNGSVGIVTAGGSGNYSYLWADGNTEATRDDLGHGVYSVTITDLSETACELPFLFVLAADVPMVAVALTEVNDITCAGAADGSAFFEATYAADFVGTADTVLTNTLSEFTNGALPAGSYCYQILDGNACTAGGACFTIEEPDPLTFMANTSPDCANGGQVQIIPFGGTAPYQFDWQDLMGTQNSSFRQNLQVGAYNLNLSDANACAVAGEISIAACNCEPVIVSSTTVQEATCGQSDGVASVNLTGEESNHIYSWSPDLGIAQGVGNMRTDLPAGAYTITVTNASSSDCYAIVDLFVGTNNGLVVSSTSTPATCGNADGGATLLPDSLTYTWEDSIAGNSRTDLASGVYQITVVDPNNPACPSVETITVFEENPLLGAVTINSQPDCEQSNGSVSLSISGGSGNYTFLWEDGTLGASRDQLPSGLYVVQISDETTGCNLPYIFVLTDNVAAATINVVDILDVSCYGQSDGGLDFSLDLDSDFVNPAASYISNGIDVFENGFLPAGNYCMVVTDGNGCNAGGTCFTIEQPDDLALNFIVTPACNNQGTVTVEVTGGTAPYISDWSDLAGVDDPLNRTMLSADTLSLVVVDQNDCMVMESELFIPECLNQLECDYFEGLEETTLNIVDCNGVAEFCLSQIAPNTQGDYEIAVDGTPYAGVIGACELDSVGLYEYVDLTTFTGPYEISAWVVNDTVFVASNTINSIAELVDFMNINDPTGNWVNDPSLLSIMGGDSNNSYGILDLRDIPTGTPVRLGENLTFISTPASVSIELGVGLSEVVLTSTDTGCSDTLSVIVNCSGDCEYFNGLDSITLPIASCLGQAEFCIDVLQPLQLDSFDIYVDDVIYGGMLGGCLLDSLGRYDTDGLIGFNGPYEISAWVVNDTVFVGDMPINTVEELVDFMKLKDPTGDWAYTMSTNKIEGGNDNMNTYGILDLRDIPSGTPIRLGEGLTYTIVPAAVYIELDFGNHEVVLVDTNTGCPDTIQVSVMDDPDLDCSTITDIINPYDTVKYTVIPSMLSTEGDTLTLTNFCEDDLNGSVGFTIDSLCVFYTGDALGPDTACIQICDELGICDTIYFDILVTSALETITDTVFVMGTDTFCLDTTIFLGSNFEITNFCPESADGNVDFFIDPINYCIEYTGLEVGQDSACIAICDDLGFCDTIYFDITVLDFNDGPVAVDDTTSTDIGEPVVIDIKANDTFLGELDTVFILEEPIYGEAFLNLDCSVTYDPEDGVCDVEDEFSYVICNVNACDTATVSVYIDCQGEIIIYTAVSPNNDGNNDVFFVAGIEFYPANQLCIFNRWGNQVYITKGYQNDWSGTWDRDKDLPDGTYYYILELNDAGGRVFKGYFELFR